MFAAVQARFRVQQSLPHRFGGRCPVSSPNCSLVPHLCVVQRRSVGFCCKVRRVVSVGCSRTIHSWRLTRYGGLLVCTDSRPGQRAVRDCRSGPLVTPTCGHLPLVRNPQRTIRSAPHVFRRRVAQCVQGRTQRTLVIDYLGDTLLEYEIACGLKSCIRHCRLSLAKSSAASRSPFSGAQG